MSGGHFDYHQYKLTYMADDIQELVDNHESEYTPETLKKMKQAIDTLKRAFIMVHRIDYLVSGDDGEDSFHKRWDRDFEELERSRKEQ